MEKPRDAFVVWARASGRASAAYKARAGDRALAAVVRFDMRVREGGVFHALATLHGEAVRAASKGFRFFRCAGVTEVIGRAWIALGYSDADAQAGAFDRAYFAQVHALELVFVQHYNKHRELYAPAE